MSRTILGRNTRSSALRPFLRIPESMTSRWASSAIDSTVCETFSTRAIMPSSRRRPVDTKKAMASSSRAARTLDRLRNPLLSLDVSFASLMSTDWRSSCVIFRSIFRISSEGFPFAS